VTAIDDFRLELGQGSEWAMALALFTMMMAVALNLKLDHFAFLKQAPKPFWLGVTSQLLVLPVLTLSLCFLLNPAPSVALGMLLIASCPGGNVSNMLVLLARGNLALSVSLTATSSLMAALVTPFAILFWSSLYPPTADLLKQINFDAIGFLVQTSLILALPLILGLIVSHRFPDLARRLRQPLILIGGGLLIAIIVVALTRYWGVFLSLGAALLGLVVIHNGLAFLAGNIVARLFKLLPADRRALTFEVGIQNSGLAIVILLSQLGGLGGAAAVAGLWGTWHIIAGLLLVLWFRRFTEVA